MMCMYRSLETRLIFGGHVLITLIFKLIVRDVRGSIISVLVRIRSRCGTGSRPAKSEKKSCMRDPAKYFVFCEIFGKWRILASKLQKIFACGAKNEEFDLVNRILWIYRGITHYLMCISVLDRIPQFFGNIFCGLGLNFHYWSSSGWSLLITILV